ncbi:hypothetical protein QBC47DRAFT_126510 [Echria macrotheca]|uniref:Uncharacterized protein n=1 Tax=Echria macrotheca TaxID=438768 RepID=A0AAJ0B1H3_9PEZI|nr:hypothetical protein QBC47DRAFT_126510 [Echria macrotheca]
MGECRHLKWDHVWTVYLVKPGDDGWRCMAGGIPDSYLPSFSPDDIPTTVHTPDPTVEIDFTPRDDRCTTLPEADGSGHVPHDMPNEHRTLPETSWSLGDTLSGIFCSLSLHVSAIRRRLDRFDSEPPLSRRQAFVRYLHSSTPRQTDTGGHLVFSAPCRTLDGGCIASLNNSLQAPNSPKTSFSHGASAPCHRFPRENVLSRQTEQLIRDGPRLPHHHQAISPTRHPKQQEQYQKKTDPPIIPLTFLLPRDLQYVSCEILDTYLSIQVSPYITYQPNSNEVWTRTAKEQDLFVTLSLSLSLIYLQSYKARVRNSLDRMTINSKVCELSPTHCWCQKPVFSWMKRKKDTRYQPNQPSLYHRHHHHYQQYCSREE